MASTPSMHFLCPLLSSKITKVTIPRLDMVFSVHGDHMALLSLLTLPGKRSSQADQDRRSPRPRGDSRSTPRTDLCDPAGDPRRDQEALRGHLCAGHRQVLRDPVVSITRSVALAPRRPVIGAVRHLGREARYLTHGPALLPDHVGYQQLGSVDHMGDHVFVSSGGKRLQSSQRTNEFSGCHRRGA